MIAIRFGVAQSANQAKHYRTNLPERHDGMALVFGLVFSAAGHGNPDIAALGTETK